MNAYDLTQYGDKIQKIFAEAQAKLDEKIKGDRTFSNDNYERFITADPTDKKVYLRWILDSYVNGGIKLYEDLLSRVKPALEDYDYLKQAGHLKPDQKIIEAYCGIVGCTKKSKEKPGLERLVDSYQSILESRREKVGEKEQIKEDAERVFESDQVIIIHPKTEAASCHYGKGTKWCTAATRGENMFNEYNEDGPLHIIIPKKPSYEGEKYQMHEESKSLMDERDEEVDGIVLSRKYSTLKDFLPFETLLIFTAIENDDIDIVKEILTKGRVDPSYNNNKAISSAAYYGNTEVARLLLDDPRVDPSNNDNWPIRWASENGNTEMVKLLLSDSRVDPSANNNYALRFAKENRHPKVVRLLLADSRVSQ